MYDATRPIVRDPGSGSQGSVKGRSSSTITASISVRNVCFSISYSSKENHASARQQDNFLELEVDSLT